MSFFARYLSIYHIFTRLSVSFTFRIFQRFRAFFGRAYTSFLHGQNLSEIFVFSSYFFVFWLKFRPKRSPPCRFPSAERDKNVLFLQAAVRQQGAALRVVEQHIRAVEGQGDLGVHREVHAAEDHAGDDLIAQAELDGGFHAGGQG